MDGVCCVVPSIIYYLRRAVSILPRVHIVGWLIDISVVQLNKIISNAWSWNLRGCLTFLCDLTRTNVVASVRPLKSSLQDKEPELSWNRRIQYLLSNFLSFLSLAPLNNVGWFSQLVTMREWQWKTMTGNERTMKEWQRTFRDFQTKLSLKRFSFVT